MLHKIYFYFSFYHGILNISKMCTWYIELFLYYFIVNSKSTVICKKYKLYVLNLLNYNTDFISWQEIKCTHNTRRDFSLEV